MHGQQRRCQEDPVSLPSGRLEKTTRSSPHHVAQHRPTGSETTPPYAPRSSRFGSEPPSEEEDVDVWCYAFVSCMPETTTTTIMSLTVLYLGGPLFFWTQCRVPKHNQLSCGTYLQVAAGLVASVVSLSFVKSK